MVVFRRRISVFRKSILVGFGIYFWWTLHIFGVPILDPFLYPNPSKMRVPQEIYRISIFGSSKRGPRSVFFGTLFGSFCTSFSGPFGGRFWTYFGPHFGPFSVPKPSKMRVPQEILRNSISGSSKMDPFWDPFSIRFGKFREGPANLKIAIFTRYFDRLAPRFG